MTQATTDTSEATPTPPLGACLELGPDTPLPAPDRQPLRHGLAAIYLTHAQVIMLDTGFDLLDHEGKPLWTR